MIVEKLVEVVKFADHYGQPYDTQLTLEWITPEWVAIKNLSGVVTKEYHKQLIKYLKECGVKKTTYFRYKEGHIYEVTREYK